VGRGHGHEHITAGDLVVRKPTRSGGAARGNLSRQQVGSALRQHLMHCGLARSQLTAITCPTKGSLQGVAHCQASTHTHQRTWAGLNLQAPEPVYIGRPEPVYIGRQSLCTLGDRACVHWATEPVYIGRPDLGTRNAPSQCASIGAGPAGTPILQRSQCLSCKNHDLARPCARLCSAQDPTAPTPAQNKLKIGACMATTGARHTWAGNREATACLCGCKATGGMQLTWTRDWACVRVTARMQLLTLARTQLTWIASGLAAASSC